MLVASAVCCVRLRVLSHCPPKAMQRDVLYSGMSCTAGCPVQDNMLPVVRVMVCFRPWVSPGRDVAWVVNTLVSGLSARSIHLGARVLAMQMGTVATAVLGPTCGSLCFPELWVERRGVQQEPP
jgi:hypothetical protein